MNFPERVRVVEVGPRDGLQSLPETLPTAVKVEMVETLARAGLEKIEVTGFVRPDVIPQLADADDLLARVQRFEGCVYRALVPNRRGAERAVAAGADELVGLITASETYNRKNQNMTVDENLAAISSIADVAAAADTPFAVAIGIAMFCPYEGDVPPGRVLSMIERVRADGVDEVYLATSVGLDGPRAVHDLASRIVDRWADLTLGLHLHDTNGMALANALAGLDAGVTVFEGSICGIGGGIRMPFGMPRFGNVATEDLVHMFAETGIDTGGDLDAVLAAARDVRELLGLEDTFSAALRGGTKKHVLELGQVSPNVG